MKMPSLEDALAGVLWEEAGLQVLLCCQWSKQWSGKRGSHPTSVRHDITTTLASRGPQEKIKRALWTPIKRRDLLELIDKVYCEDV